MPLNTKTKRLAWGAACLAALAGLAAPCIAGRLDDVRARGHLICGVSEGPAGFSTVDERGNWAGMDVDYCAALATAVFGRRDAVKYRPLTTGDRFTALKSGEVDVLARSTTWTLSRDTELGVRFVGALYYDGQGVMVRRSQGVTSALELSGATVCVAQRDTAEQNLQEFFGQRGMRYMPLTFEKWDDTVQAYLTKRCAALTADASVLALVRAKSGSALEHQILPEVLSKEPMGPVVAQGDEQWFSIVRWVLFALITAEEYDVGSATIDLARTSKIIEVRRFLGIDFDPGKAMGLSRDWTYQVVKQVGNYRELFERNLGIRSPLKLDRGSNLPWTQGGLLYAPPFR